MCHGRFSPQKPAIWQLNNVVLEFLEIQVEVNVFSGVSHVVISA